MIEMLLTPSTSEIHFQIYFNTSADSASSGSSVSPHLITLIQESFINPEEGVSSGFSKVTSAPTRIFPLYKLGYASLLK